MSSSTARRTANLVLIVAMAMVAIIGISLQTRSIESKARQSTGETVTVASEADTSVQPGVLLDDSARQPDLTAGNGLAATLWKVIIYAILIVAAIVIGARILKRYGGDRLKQASSPDIRILGRRYINPKQSIMIVKVRHKELLLGITDHSIQLLYDFTKEEKEGDGTEFA